jgi:hypothetical protein
MHLPPPVKLMERHIRTNRSIDSEFELESVERLNVHKDLSNRVNILPQTLIIVYERVPDPFLSLLVLQTPCLLWMRQQLPSSASTIFMRSFLTEFLPEIRHFGRISYTWS